MSYRFMPSSSGHHLIALKNMALFCFIVSFLFPSSAQPATYIVTNGNDSGSGSLRDTLSGTAPGDIVNFDASASPILLTSGPIIIPVNDLTISNTGSTTITINGNGQQIFTLSNTGNGVNLNNLVFTGGSFFSNGGVLGSAFSYGGAL